MGGAGATPRFSAGSSGRLAVRGFSRAGPSARPAKRAGSEPFSTSCGRVCAGSLERAGPSKTVSSSPAGSSAFSGWSSTTGRRGAAVWAIFWLSSLSLSRNT